MRLISCCADMRKAVFWHGLRPAGSAYTHAHYQLSHGGKLQSVMRSTLGVTLHGLIGIRHEYSLTNGSAAARVEHPRRLSILPATSPTPDCFPQSDVCFAKQLPSVRVGHVDPCSQSTSSPCPHPDNAARRCLMRDVSPEPRHKCRHIGVQLLCYSPLGLGRARRRA